MEAGDQLTMTGWQWKKVPLRKDMSPPHNDKMFLQANAISQVRIKEFLVSDFQNNIGEGGFLCVDMGQ